MRNLRLILIFAVVTLVTAAVVPLLYWTPKVLGCRTNSDPSSFLAYCDTSDFADYEHGAYFWDLEPSAVKSLKAARVLFLGNSRVQHAFSADATRNYFQEKGVGYYITGFSYGENMVFIERLIKKYDLHPSAVVINADESFFDQQAKPIPSTFAEPKTELSYWSTFYNYLLKAIFSRIERPLCNHAPFLCAQDVRSIWRDRTTGAWDWESTFVAPNYSRYPMQPSMRTPPPDEAGMRKIENAAKSFVETTLIPRDCIILTAIPSSRITDEPVANQVGEHQGLPVVVPHLDDLTTIDLDHLDKGSAERWSDAFLHQATPLLNHCLLES